MSKSLTPIAKAFKEAEVVDKYEVAVGYNPEVIIDSHRTINAFRKYCDKHNAYLLATRHGVANKYIGPDKEFGLSDYFIGSDWDKKDCLSHGVEPKQGFLITGNPWVDEVFKIPKRELNTKCPTILFAPTWNEETSAAFYFQNRLYDLIASVFPEFKLIVKLHPAIIHAAKYKFNFNLERPVFEVDQKYRHNAHQLCEIWAKISAEHDNVSFVTETNSNIADFYDQTDILISDGSSLIWEFMVLDRPIILYNSETIPGMWQERKSDMAFANSKREVGVNFSTDVAFSQILKNIFALHARETSAVQKLEVEEIYGRFVDGKNRERVIQAIRELPKTPVFFIKDADESSEQIKKSYEDHYVNIDFQFLNTGVFSSDDEIEKLQYSFEGENYAVITNIDTDCVFFKSCYIGAMRTQAKEDGVVGLVASRLQGEASNFWAELTGSIENLKFGHSLFDRSTDIPGIPLNSKETKFFFCIKIDDLEVKNLKDLFTIALQNVSASAHTTHIETYGTGIDSSRYVVSRLKRTADQSGIQLRELLNQSKLANLKFLKDSLKFSEYLNKAVIEFEPANYDRSVEILQYISKTTPNFAPGVVALAKVTSMGKQPVRAIQILLNAIENNPSEQLLLKQFCETLYQFEVDQPFLPNDTDKHFSHPFGYIDRPFSGSAVSGIVPLMGWAIRSNKQNTKLLLTVDGVPYFNHEYYARDDIHNAFKENFGHQKIEGFYTQIDTSGLTPGTCHRAELHILENNTVYSVSRKAFFVNL